MITRHEHPVQYEMVLGDNRVGMNEHVGKHVQLRFLGEINCISCGRKTNKSFQQGYCFPCMRSLPECDSCIVKPETCHFDAGTCRDPEWGQTNCFQDHYVYLANSSGIKVGITRGSQIPTRWMDQGATQALPIFRVNNRLLSGLVEVALKQHVSDRTDWRKMLKGVAVEVDLLQRRDELVAKCEIELAALADQYGADAITQLDEQALVEIDFPVLNYPEKVKSFNFDKTELVEGTLEGIKGQYLIFDNGVINMRKFGGYLIEMTV
ncbi:MAG TPA: DUF2797 domain-containing protein [Candidatus Tenderia electrophaga]|uniref:DUF2797 domain-containing protein n=1 Tax=Candidatus Tenderia electrophaga TaxID=1748243 RepID=A0A832N386_9GAMM|nr:DUF2797 domain-containing protein [Candidatus Tenderia electrophaga]